MWFKNDSRCNRNNNPTKRSEWYQSNIDLMSSTESPTSSWPTNAATHNSAAVQRSWRHALYFRMIWAGRMGQIEFHCRLAQFVISKRFGIVLRLWWITMEIERQCDEFGGKRGPPQEKKECLMWCARWTKGVRMVMEEYRMILRGANPGQGAPMGDWKAPMQGSSPSRVSSAERWGRWSFGHEIEALLIEVEEGIEERPS